MKLRVRLRAEEGQDDDVGGEDKKEGKSRFSRLKFNSFGKGNVRLRPAVLQEVSGTC